jgi:hypothetical protein
MIVTEECMGGNPVCAAIIVMAFEPNACLFHFDAKHKRRYSFLEFCRKYLSGWWDLNPRPPGPEPGAIPSFATARFIYEKPLRESIDISCLSSDLSGAPKCDLNQQTRSEYFLENAKSAIDIRPLRASERLVLATAHYCDEAAPQSGLDVLGIKKVCSGE